MCNKTDFELCRLCLNCGGLLMKIFDEDSKLGYVLENTIEDLIGVKVVEESSYPWLVGSDYMEKLTEFLLFKRRCAECSFVFHNRIQKGRNRAPEDWVTNREEEASDVRGHDEEKSVKEPGKELAGDTSSKVLAFNSPIMAEVDHSGQTVTVQMEDTCTVSSWMNWMANNNYNAVQIQIGDRVGLLQDASGNLHFFVNGVDHGTFSKKLPFPLYGCIQFDETIRTASLMDGIATYGYLLKINSEK
ncbi:uncharacterized protein [Hetaerina americana]|uniref:uncharacterized protein n=1 Tax=Hetaerina americana TaxID=62018 RepID=UPI003A7F45E3